MDFFKNYKLKFYLGSKAMFIVIITMLLASFIAISAVNNKIDILEAQKKSVETSVVDMHYKNTELREKMSNMNTKSGMKQIAIEELDMAIKGSRIFEIVE